MFWAPQSWASGARIKYVPGSAITEWFSIEWFVFVVAILVVIRRVASTFINGQNGFHFEHDVGYIHLYILCPIVKEPSADVCVDTLEEDIGKGSLFIDISDLALLNY